MFNLPAFFEMASFIIKTCSMSLEGALDPHFNAKILAPKKCHFKIRVKCEREYILGKLISSADHKTCVVFYFQLDRIDMCIVFFAANINVSFIVYAKIITILDSM